MLPPAAPESAQIPYAYLRRAAQFPQDPRTCWEDAAFRVLTGSQPPDHSRISGFRRRCFDALAGLCQKAGLLSLGRMAPR